jgi:hypothetical protein
MKHFMKPNGDYGKYAIYEEANSNYKLIDNPTKFEKADALLTYVLERNSRYSKFYKKSESEVRTEFVKELKSKDACILEHFNIYFDGEIEEAAVNALVNDVFNSLDKNNVVKNDKLNKNDKTK